MEVCNEFDDIYSWNLLLWKQLKEFVVKKRVPQAIIINGQNGLGKTALANKFAALLLCHDLVKGNACGYCASCCLIRQGSHIDLSYISAEEGSNIIKIEQIRGLSEKLTKSAAVGKRKVAIIDGADTMQDKAANSLLKTLEEPSDNTIIILITTNIAKVPATIKSRCSYVPVTTPLFEQVSSFMSNNTDAPDADIRLAYHFSMQAPLTTLDVLNNDRFKNIIGTVRSCYLSKDVRATELISLLKSDSLTEIIKASYLIIYELISFKVFGVSYAGPIFSSYDNVDSLIGNVDIYELYEIYDYHNELYSEISMGTVWQPNTMLVSLGCVWNKFFKGGVC